MTKTFIIILALSSFFGCDKKYETIELKLKNKNPVSYEYEASVLEIHNVIVSKLIEEEKNYIKFASDSVIVWGKDILSKKENVNDAYLQNVLFDSSLIYYNKDRVIPYWYSLHLHITEINDHRTKIEIFTINPRIGIGVRFPYSIGFPSEPGAALEKTVPPTTIEEYKILLAIGGGLGVKEKMPKLILPDTLK